MRTEGGAVNGAMRPGFSETNVMISVKVSKEVSRTALNTTVAKRIHSKRCSWQIITQIGKERSRLVQMNEEEE